MTTELLKQAREATSVKHLMELCRAYAQASIVVATCAATHVSKYAKAQEAARAALSDTVHSLLAAIDAALAAPVVEPKTSDADSAPALRPAPYGVEPVAHYNAVIAEALSVIDATVLVEGELAERMKNAILGRVANMAKDTWLTDLKNGATPVTPAPEAQKQNEQAVSLRQAAQEEPPTTPCPTSLCDQAEQDFATLLAPLTLWKGLARQLERDLHVSRLVLAEAQDVLSLCARYAEGLTCYASSIGDYPPNAVAPAISDVLAKVGAALEAAPQGKAQPEGWRPIESAPRDGTVILATLPGSDVCYVIGWADPTKNIRREWCDKLEDIGWHMEWDGHFLGNYDQPTHWMPLPAAPAQEGAAT